MNSCLQVIPEEEKRIGKADALTYFVSTSAGFCETSVFFIAHHALLSQPLHEQKSELNMSGFT